MRKDVPEFDSGDTVRVHVKIVEGDKERIQVFEGVVMEGRAAVFAKDFAFANSRTESAWSASSRCIPRESTR